MTNLASTDMKLSVIVISIYSINVLQRCITALKNLPGQDEMEIIVVRNEDRIDTEYTEIKTRFDGIHWIVTPVGCTVPDMRWRAITASCGDIVALLEDDCRVDEHWKTALLNAHEEDCIAVGGAVEPGNYTRGLDWSVYFCEFVRFMLPFPQHGTDALAGNNVSYKRVPLLDSTGDLSDSGFYDVFIHGQLGKAGHHLKSDSSVIVSNINSWAWRHVLNVPFNHGRGFAAMRVEQGTLWQRLLYAFATPLLPVLQVSRIFVHVTGRRRHVLEFFLSLPWTALFCISWSAGEFIGYLAGPGDSLQQWH